MTKAAIYQSWATVVYSAGMSDMYFSGLRRQLLTALAGALLLTTRARASNSHDPLANNIASLPGDMADKAPPLALQVCHADISPNFFLTLSSVKHSHAALEHLARSTILPLLEPAGILRACGPTPGALQLWLQLEPHMLEHYGLDIDTALSILAKAVHADIASVPGHHRLHAWALQRPHTSAEVDAANTTLVLPDDMDTPLFALGTLLYTLAPPPWAEQACFSFQLASQSRATPQFEQHCTALLQHASDTLPEGLEIQLGRLGDPLKTVPTLYVCLHGSTNSATA